MSKIKTFEFRLSGGAANADPDLSIGGAISSVSVVNSTKNNLFNDVSLADALAGEDFYRCIYLLAGDYSYTGLAAWLSSLTPSPGTKTYIGLATEGINATAAAIGDEETVPPGVTFVHPTSAGGGLDLPDMDSTDYIGLWIRQAVSAETEGAVGDYFRLSLDGTEDVYDPDTLTSETGDTLTTEDADTLTEG